MKQGMMQYVAMGAMFSELMDDTPGSPGNVRNKPCPSTKVRQETCPGCGDTHKSNKHLYCSKECNPHIQTD